MINIMQNASMYDIIQLRSNLMDKFIERILAPNNVICQNIEKGLIRGIQTPQGACSRFDA